MLEVHPMNFNDWLYIADSSGWFGLVGLALTIVGFGVTLRNVIRSQRASEDAREAAQEAVVEVQKLKVVTDLSAALSELDEVRRLQRESNWASLPDRMSRVRKLLIGIRIRHPELSVEDKEAVRTAAIVFSEIELQLERHLRDGVAFNAHKMSGHVMNQIDNLSEIIAKIV